MVPRAGSFSPQLSATASFSAQDSKRRFQDPQRHASGCLGNLKTQEEMKGVWRVWHGNQRLRPHWPPSSVNADAEALRVESH